MSISAISRAQGPVQAFLRPAMWIPYMRNLRYHTETKQFARSRDDLFNALVAAFQQWNSEVAQGGEGLLRCKLHLHTQDAARGYLEVHCYTFKAEWLDVVQVYIADNGTVRVRSWSSGFMPTCVPVLGPLLSVALFWLPFSGRDPKLGWTNSLRESEPTAVFGRVVVVVVALQTTWMVLRATSRPCTVVGHCSATGGGRGTAVGCPVSGTSVPWMEMRPGSRVSRSRSSSPCTNAPRK
eukprot:m.210007 g.210007  ORF g.210007 m.210007 type:complete len:238 (+) comp22102_c1_seq25:31-744(+)